MMLDDKQRADWARKARELIGATRTTQAIAFDRGEPTPLQLIARKRRLLDLFRKKADPFAMSARKFDAWTAEIEALHPSRRDMLREGRDTPHDTGRVPLDVPSLDLPPAADAMVAGKPKPQSDF